LKDIVSFHQVSYKAWDVTAKAPFLYHNVRNMLKERDVTIGSVKKLEVFFGKFVNAYEAKCKWFGSFGGTKNQLYIFKGKVCRWLLQQYR